MFRIFETIHTRDNQPSNRYLPLGFQEGAEAVEHIALLQTQFSLSGFDHKQRLWWAKNNNASEVYLWAIEGETTGVGIEGETMGVSRSD